MKAMPEDIKTTDDTWKRFGPVLAAKREAAGLLPAQAARRAGYSPNIWGQVERGYRIDHGVEIEKKPSREFIIKAVRMLHEAGVEWDLAEALALGGEKPERLPADNVDRMPANLMTTWNRLSKQQQRALLWTMQLMVDPHAGLVGDPVPEGDKATPLFVAADTEHQHRT
jgi:hypothetical protein